MSAEQRGWTFERGTLWAIEMAPAESSLQSQVSPRLKTSFTDARRESAPELATAMGLPDSAVVKQRFAAGSRCFVGRVDERIATYGWVSWKIECVGELERSIRLQAEEAYIWDCATLPQFRRQRLYSALLVHMAAVLQSESITRVWIGSSLGNRPSLLGFRLAGFQPAIRLYHLRLLRLRLSWWRRYQSADRALAAAARHALQSDNTRAFGPLSLNFAASQSGTACASIEA